MVAVGNPFGLGGTVTAGIVSARGRDIGAGPYDDYIQIDAPINRGNSGGPTFDTEGNVIGVNTAIFSPSGGSVGIGFDIPAETVKTVVAQLKDKGHVTRGWLGVQIQPVTADIADCARPQEGRRAPWSPSRKPAARPPRPASRPATSSSRSTARRSRIRASSPARSAPWRRLDGEARPHPGRQTSKTISLTLAQMPNQQQAQADTGISEPTSGAPHLGLSLAPASEVSGAGGQGVVVTAVDPDGPAADQGIQTGDVILDVGGKSVANPGDVRKALIDAKAQGKHEVLMRVKSGDATRFVALPLGDA